MAGAQAQDGQDLALLAIESTVRDVLLDLASVDGLTDETRLH
jgi:hypothetical protein